MKFDTEKYTQKNITIAVLGGHSALDVCAGAKKHGLKTLAVCQKGREKTYAEYYKSHGRFGCIDEVLLVDKFADIVKPEVQKELKKRNAIFIHNRYFWVYCDFDKVEDREIFTTPIFGNRTYVRFEERDSEKNQYWLLEKAGIRIPKIICDGFRTKNLVIDGKKAAPSNYFESTIKIFLKSHFQNNPNSPVIVKVNEAIRSYERAFFVANSYEDYSKKSRRMIKEGKITKTGLQKAVIEEFIIGAQVNFNYFYSPISKRLELMGTDARRQTSLDGFLRLNANVQKELLDSGYNPTMVETGHYAVTIKESLIEKAYEIGEKFVEATEKYYGKKIIGPFALQGAVSSENGHEELVIFDVSMRIPGSPGTKFTPYTSYLWGEPMSYGERIASEIKEAIVKDTLDKILT